MTPSHFHVYSLCRQTPSDASKERFGVKNAVWRRLPDRLSETHPSSGDNDLLLGRKNLVCIDARPIHVQRDLDRLPFRR